MTDLIRLRMDTVVGLSNCPVCGSAALYTNARRNYARAYFNCGSVFSATGIEDIRADIGCPGPTAVAVRALNDEARSLLVSLTLAGAA